MVDSKCWRYSMVLHRMVKCSQGIDLCAADHGKFLSLLVDGVWEVRHSLPLVQWLKTHSFIGHSDGHPAQFSTTPLSVCFGRAMPFRPCCGNLRRHAIDAERRDQGARGAAGHNAV